MTIGTYETTDPDKRVKIVFDEEYPTENPDFPYEEGVLDDFIKYYGAILLEHQVWKNAVTGETWGGWEETDSVWGCAGYENPAQDIAKEYFNVEVTEKV